MARSLLRSTPARATCITARDRHPLFPARAKAPVRLRSSSRAVRSLQQRRGPQQPAAASGAPPLDEAGQQDGPPEEFTLILYTKPDCPLCEGLQQKLEAVSCTTVAPKRQSGLHGRSRRGARVRVCLLECTWAATAAGAHLQACGLAQLTGHHIHQPRCVVWPPDQNIKAGVPPQVIDRAQFVPSALSYARCVCLFVCLFFLILHEIGECMCVYEGEMARQDEPTWSGPRWEAVCQAQAGRPYLGACWRPCSLTRCARCRVEVRNIQTSPAWEAAYAMEVPVLAWAEADGSNEVSQRLSFHMPFRKSVGPAAVGGLNEVTTILFMRLLVRIFSPIIAFFRPPGACCI